MDNQQPNEPQTQLTETEVIPTQDIPQPVLIPSPDPATNRPWWRQRTTLIVAIILVLLIAAGGTWYFMQTHSTKPVPSATVVKSASTKLIVPAPAASASYYQAPKQLSNLNFFSDLVGMFGTSCTGTQTTNCPPAITADQISYNQIGTTTKGQPIIVLSNHSSADASFEYVAVGLGNNTYSILAKLTFNETDSNYPAQLAQLKKSLSSNVTVDTTTTIPSLMFPSSTPVAGQNIALPGGESYPAGYLINGLSDIRGSYFKSTVAASDMKKIGELNGTSYYEVTVPKIGDSNYQVKEYYGVINGVFAASYKAVEPLATDSNLAINWNTGNHTNTTNYTYSAGGCGSPTGFVVVRNVTADQLSVAGQGPSGITIYQLNTASPLFKDYYNEYGSGADLGNSSLKNLSPDQYQAAHSLVFTKNAFGEYVAYQRGDMLQGGGCGKPVIYLYPQHTTTVHVSVGANITVSDPLYTSNGWNNVIAHQNGQLSYQGKTYGSLFWEGTGYGPYPLITAGTIVPRDKVVSTITQQLHDQGLTAKETSDFLAYWQPKLPATPYTRLSWLNTEQMNTLAPLTVSPKPSTMIRIFLDFQGLQTNRSIAPQTFHAPTRTGFTLVEWGGLLH
jgi:hypothetical protein